MIYPDVSVDVWAKRYGLSQEPRACAKCGKLQPFTKPIATADWRGISAEDHEPCGPDYTMQRLVVADKEERAEWKAAVRELYGHLKGPTHDD